MLLELFLLDNDFTDLEKDVKLLMTSLLGILKKNFGKSEQEKTRGL